MSRRVCAIFILFSCHLAVAADRFDSVKRSIRTLLRERRVPSVAVAVAQRGSIVWEEGFGWANRERLIPATANTMYSLASISKPVTATALMTLVNAGKIDLDRPINDYLGNAKLRARIGSADDATVRRVANHSSGLPEHYQFFFENEPWRRPTADETILKYGNLVTVPGEHFRYSNLGYGVLSYVISRVSGHPFADYLRREVFLPLGMVRSSAELDPASFESQAVRYGEDGLPIPFYETDHDGASAVYSSVHDLVRFGMFHLKSHLGDQVPILPDALIDAMQRPTMSEGDGDEYSIGWETRHASGYTIVSHDGGMPGVRTELRLVPSEGLVVVVLCNAEDRLAPIVADEIMGVMLPKWKTPPRPERPSASFVPPPEWVGVWTGKISTYESEIPITLRILESGDVHVELAHQLKSLLNFPRISKAGFLSGAVAGNIGIKDAARRPYYLGLSLKLRPGNVLSGVITARADKSGVAPTYGLFPSVGGRPPPERVQTEVFILAQWAELTRQ